jgi:hypothetical protein
LLVLGGCGGKTHDLAKVSGTVTLDNQPLAEARVVFQPIGTGKGNPGPGSSGVTDANGRYSLRAATDAVGAVVGSHRVSITLGTGTTNPDSDQPAKPTRRQLPARYNTNTELTCEVPAGGTDKADFALWSKENK